MFGVFKMKQASPQVVPASTPQTPEPQLARSTASQSGMHASSQAMQSSTAQPLQPTLPPLTAATAAILGRALVTESKPPVTGPRRGSFDSDIPHGHRMPRPIVPGTPLISEDLSLDLKAASRTINFAKTALLNSGRQTNGMTTMAYPGGNNSPGNDSATDSDPSLDHLKQEHARSVTSAPANLMENLKSTDSTFHVAPPLNSSKPNSVGRSNSNHSKPITSSSNLSSLATSSSESSDPSKKQRTYVLPDGTVLDSGKGLGRGRPGIKRGPRKKKKDQTGQSLSEQPTVQSPAPVTSTPATPISPQVSKKRKRSSVDESKAESNTSDSDISILDDSDEYNPQETMTRSGRNVARPALFVPPTMSSPAPKKPRLSSSTSTSTKIPLIKKKIYRGREQLALCEHCTRGNGPPGNAIVFCDACNKCWHQRCHEPLIPKQLVVNTKAEWFCAECTKTLQKVAARKGKAGKAAAAQVKATGVKEVSALTGRLIGAFGLMPTQREQYLDSLPKAELVKIVLGITDSLPELPVFPESLGVSMIPAAPAPEPPTTIPQPAGTMRPPPLPPAKQNVPEFVDVDVDEEDDDEFLDEHARLYPKPGNGVASLFPPESEDLHILLEGPECRTFSHFLAPAPVVVAAA